MMQCDHPVWMWISQGGDCSHLPIGLGGVDVKAVVEVWTDGARPTLLKPSQVSCDSMARGFSGHSLLGIHELTKSYLAPSTSFFRCSPPHTHLLVQHLLGLDHVVGGALPERLEHLRVLVHQGHLPARGRAEPHKM